MKKMKKYYVFAMPQFYTTYLFTLEARFDVENFGRDHKLKVCMYQV